MRQRRLLSWLLVPLTTAALVITGPGAAEATPAPASAKASLAASPGCGKAPTLRSGTYTIQSNGKNRSFILSVPDNYNSATQYRLVFGYHWLGGTMQQVAGGGSDGEVYAHYGLRALANNTAIFVAPQGLNKRLGQLRR